MLGQDSEDEIWSRFVFELVIWTQPSGPFCQELFLTRWSLRWSCYHWRFYPTKLLLASSINSGASVISSRPLVLGWKMSHFAPTKFCLGSRWGAILENFSGHFASNLLWKVISFCICVKRGARLFHDLSFRKSEFSYTKQKSPSEYLFCVSEDNIHLLILYSGQTLQEV